MKINNYEERCTPLVQQHDPRDKSQYFRLPLMRIAAFGISYMDMGILESFLKTKWKILDYTKNKLSFEEVRNKKPSVLISFFPPEELLLIPSVKYIISPGAGIDGFDGKKVSERNQIVINTHGNASSVAEHAWSMLMSLTRKIGKYDSLIRERIDWPSSSHIYDYNTDLTGKTLGIIGYGAIGKILERYGKAFEMDVKIFRNNPVEGQFFDYELEEQADDLDVLIIACPLTPKTKGLVSETVLKKLPSHSFLINVGRGLVLDELALFDALRNGELAGAGIDTWQNSPYLRDERGNKPDSFMDVPNLIISPHRAWVSKQSHIDVLKAVAGELDLIAHNEKSENIVDFEIGY